MKNKTIRDMKVGDVNQIRIDLFYVIDGQTYINESELVSPVGSFDSFGNRFTVIVKIDDRRLTIDSYGYVSIVHNLPAVTDDVSIKQSQIPNFVNNRMVKEMNVAEQGFVPHWALYIDGLGYVWIRKNFGIHDESFGESHVRIIRFTNRVIVDSETLCGENIGRGPIEHGDFPVVLI